MSANDLGWVGIGSSDLTTATGETGAVLCGALRTSSGATTRGSRGLTFNSDEALPGHFSVSCILLTDMPLLAIIAALFLARYRIFFRYLGLISKLFFRKSSTIFVKGT